MTKSILKNIIYLLHLINDSTKIECSKNSQLPYTMKILRQKSFAVFYMFIKLLYVKVQDDTIQILLTCKVCGIPQKVFLQRSMCTACHEIFMVYSIT